MGLSSHRSKNLVIAAALLGAVGILAVRRLPRWLGEPVRFSDGHAVWSDVRAQGVRHAVWDRPESLGAEVNSDAHEARPALSPDGRWLVYAACGAADWDLWVAELEHGRPRAARPLAALNTAADDLAPAFGPDGLYLASNRPGGAGGFDLWVAPFADGSAGPARALEGSVNTTFDELDPAPGRTAEGEALLVFVSDRSGGLDLFAAWPERAADGDARALTGLNTPADEREPCLAPDGLSLFFASAAGGSFALARSFRAGEDWLAPQPLAGLESAGPARAPALSADGFSLYCEAPRPGLDGTAGDPGDLCLSRSRELNPLAPADLGWKDLLLVSLLLATALLAWLAKRWHELDVLYKCFLASVLAHLLAMWILRDVRPESGMQSLPADGGPTFRVQVLRDSSLAAAQRERSGALESARSASAPGAQPQRLELAAPVAPLELAPAQAVEARASALAAVPARQAQTLERPAQTAVQSAPALSAPEQVFERYAASAPAAEPNLPSALESGSRIVAAAQPDAPARANLEVADASRAALQVPAAGALERPAAAAVQSPDFAGSASERVAAAHGARAPSLAAPAESLAPPQVAEGAPAGPQARAFAPEPDAGLRSGAAGPLAPGGDLATHPASQPELSAPTGSQVARRAQPALAAGGPRSGSPVERAESLTSTPPPALVVPRENLSPSTGLAAGSAQGGSAPAAQAFTPEHSARAERPAPLALDAPRPALSRAAAPAPVEALAARPSAEDGRLPEAPGPLFDTPYRTRFGSEKSTALREHGGGVDTEAAVARGLDYLASIQNDDGSWGSAGARHPKYRQVAVGKTGLALLAFLGAGHTPVEGDHARVADAAVGFLLASQARSNGHFGDGDAYSHGIATYALGECFALTREDRLRAPLEAALARILAAQVREGPARLVGGWSYYYRDDAVYDAWPRVSISAWQVMALESARLGGLDVPDQAFDAARAFLLGSWDGRLGAFRYSHDPERTRSNYATLPGSTPAALFALALLGEDLASAAYGPARAFVDERAPAGYRYGGDDDFVRRAQGNLYFWYYGTLASFRQGGRPWERWNTALKETLLPSQQADGSWVPLDIYARDYAGDGAGDRSYTTALCVLSLEVYYRYFTPLLRVR